MHTQKNAAKLISSKGGPYRDRKIAHLMRRKHGGRRARVRGTEKVGADFSLLAAAVNLARLGALGRPPRGWMDPSGELAVQTRPMRRQLGACVGPGGTHSARRASSTPNPDQPEVSVSSSSAGQRLQDPMRQTSKDTSHLENSPPEPIPFRCNENTCLCCCNEGI